MIVVDGLFLIQPWFFGPLDRHSIRRENVRISMNVSPQFLPFEARNVFLLREYSSYTHIGSAIHNRPTLKTCGRLFQHFVLTRPSFENLGAAKSQKELHLLFLV